jgi:hypothetical protein
LLPIPCQKLGSLIAWQIVCPVALDFGISAHIIQIPSRVEEMGLIPLLALWSNDLGMLFKLISK